MRQGGFVVGAIAGLMLAVIFVVGVSAIGPAALHIDLAPAPTSASAGSQADSYPSGQTNGATVSSPNTMAKASSGGTPFSALSALPSDGGTSLALLFVPLLLGVSVGAALYGISRRRTEVE